MTTQAVERSWAVGSDAAFRNAGGGFSASLSNLGFTKVYTNLDWAAAVRPALGNSPNSSYGPIFNPEIEVWKSNDGKTDFFLKLRYGKTGSSPYGDPGDRRGLRIQYQVWTQHLGDGVMAGRKSALREIGPMNPNPTGDAENNYQQGPSVNQLNSNTLNLFSGNPGRLSMQWGAGEHYISEYWPNGITSMGLTSFNRTVGNPSHNFAWGMLAIERFKNDDGSDNNDGIFVYSVGPWWNVSYPFSEVNGSSFLMDIIPFDESVEQTTQVTPNITCNNSRSSSISNLEKTVFPFQPTIGARNINPPIGFIGAFNIDTIQGLNTGIKVYNLLKTYRKGLSYYRPVDGTVYDATRILQLWE